jgi:hypothetical protein
MLGILLSPAIRSRISSIEIGVGKVIVSPLHAEASGMQLRLESAQA